MKFVVTYHFNYSPNQLQQHMDPYRQFFNYLNRFVDFHETEFIEWIKPCLTVRKFAKKRILVNAGNIEDNLNFLVSGLARKYFVKGSEEINIQLATEGQLIYSNVSFYSRMPSEYVVETIEPATFVSIAHGALMHLYAKSTKMERLGRLIVTESLVTYDRRQLDMIRLTPRERFLHFVNQNPELLQRVPQKLLASYLSIQPETFSRFKHLLKEKRDGVPATTSHK